MLRADFASLWFPHLQKDFSVPKEMLLRSRWLLGCGAGGRTLTPECLRGVILAIVKGTGSEPKEAEIVADHLVRPRERFHPFRLFRNVHGSGVMCVCVIVGVFFG